MEAPDPHNLRKGVTAALAAYISWGLMPIFFKLLASVNAWEIIAHRVVWGVPVLLVFLLVRDGRHLWSRLAISGRQAGWLFVSGCLIATNWFIFVWAVVNDNVLLTSLGYFINPLVNILFGFLFLQERLTPYQKWAVAIAASGTAYLAWFLGQPPWIALALAFTFAAYGLVRKRLDVGPMRGLMWEYLLVLGPAAAYLAWLSAGGKLAFMHTPGAPNLWLMLSGLMTVLPLIWFNMAAQRLTLTMIGFIQYLAPSMSFCLAVFLWDEPFTQGHAVAFGCIWAALALVTLSPLRRRLRVNPLD